MSDQTKAPWKSLLLSTFTSLFLAHPVTATPIRRSVVSIPDIDAGKDAWAEALSGISPLVLLVGERNTKQLIREMHHLPHMLGIAFAPLGLISVLTSTIRLCGGHTLRAFLGYEQEPRVKAALELTRANCGGLQAELVYGRIVRNATPDPTSQALAITMIEGKSQHTVEECLTQIQNGYQFERDRDSKGCPAGVAKIRWVLNTIFSSTLDRGAAEAIADVIQRAMNIEKPDEVANSLHVALTDHSQAGNFDSISALDKPQGISPQSAKDTNMITVTQVRTDNIQSQPPHSEGHEPNKVAKIFMKDSERGKDGAKSHSRRTMSPPSNSGKIHPANKTTLPEELEASFCCTFEGVSELSGIPGAPIVQSTLLAAFSAIAILAIQMSCFWQDGWWTVSSLLVFVGYIGMVIGVTFCAWFILSACKSATLRIRPAHADVKWRHGLLVAVKNTDSLDTMGSRFWQSAETMDDFEAVWLRHSGTGRFVSVWVVSVFLTLSFVCHYLGLRTSRWWLSVGELVVCLIAAFVRSSTKAATRRYDVVEDVYLDKRCYSTGIINMQRATQLGERSGHALNLRIYSFQQTNCLPFTGEFIAWRGAKLCLERPELAQKILSATGMQLFIYPDEGCHRKLVVLYDGGILTDEGLGFPNTKVCLAFRCTTADMAAPTPLLARGIMRQAEWYLDFKDMKKEKLPFIGGTYITSFDSLITWWTIAEDRNEMGDQHKNLHGSFIVLNMAFFLALLQCAEADDIRSVIEKAHSKSGAEDQGFANSIVEFLSTMLVN